MVRTFWQWAVFGVVALPAAAWAQDADGDGVANAVDAFPCDAQFSAAAYAPSQGAHGTVFFEDQWPSAGDLDFNDVVVSYHYELRYDALGRVVALHATFNPLALGGMFDNGLALHLPVPRGALASASRTVEGGAPEALTVSLDDAELTLTVSNNLRELFSGQAGQINSTGTNTLNGLAVEVNLTFATPVTLSAGPAPYDLFIFRSGVPGHQIHRPEFSGTAQMANSLFGTSDDGSSAGRWFVDGFGLPFALVVPQNVPYPSEGTAISSLFPNIVNFAASGGATHNDFYISSVNGAAYQGARVAPRFVTNRAASTTCVATGGYQLFTSSGVFTPPAGVTNVRVLVIGGGGGGGGGHQGGGGSGYVRYGNYSVSGPVTVTVGNGGSGAPGSASNDQPSGTNGAVSSFGSHLSANGGETTPGVNIRGGHGGSGGGGSGNGGAATYVGGTGQGSFTSLLNNFSRATLSVGTGGAGGTSSHGGGGGGGGVLVNGSGPTADSGPHSISGRGGQGYGAGGGAGGYNSGWSPARAAGGAGATGMVLVEWDGGSGSADAGVADSGATDSGAAPTGNYQIFTTSGTFVPPAGVTTVRVLAVGGGGGGGGGHQGGGGSGYVRSGTFNVSGNVAVTVGSGGAGAPGSASNDQPSGVNGTATLFGAFLSANGGETTPGVNTRGGHGGSGGGGSGNGGVGAAGGANGANGGAATYQGGTGQGAFTSVLSIFTRATISAAAAGAGGTSSHGGGGGGGGVFISGAGPSAGSGPQSTSGRGGQGYGAGGGGGGYNSGWSPARAAGGAGANGVVYVEW